MPVETPSDEAEGAAGIYMSGSNASLSIRGTGTLIVDIPQDCLTGMAVGPENLEYRGIVCDGKFVAKGSAQLRFTLGHGDWGTLRVVGISAGEITLTDGVVVTTYASQSTYVVGLGGPSVTINGNAKFVFETMSDGKPYWMFGFSRGISGGSVQIGGNAQVDIDVYSEKYATGIYTTESCAIGGNARVSARSDSTSDKDNYGVMAPGIAISDNAGVVAAGPMGAFSVAPDYSKHTIEGVVVSTDESGDPEDLAQWDGLTPLGGTDSPYRYVGFAHNPVIARVAGEYANETAAAISAVAFPNGSEWVVIARDDDFADALGATGLAGALSAPIILTDRESLSAAAAAEIERLGATRAFIIGGTGAIKEQVDADLAALGVAVQPRVWGENSYDTSLACAEMIVDIRGTSDAKVIVAMSTSFQDALSVSPIAYRLNCPLILQTWGDTAADRGFTDEAKAFLAGKSPLVVGGPGAISDESFEGIALGEPPFRIYGETGYDTSNEIADWAVGMDWLASDNVVIACGAQKPKGVDALAGSALAGKLGCPILLVNGNDAMEDVDLTTIEKYLTENAYGIKGQVFVLGGAYVVPQDVYDKVAAIVGAIEA